MGVQVDQSRRDDRAGHVPDVGSGIGLQVGADAGDLALREGDIGHGIEPLRGIDQTRFSQDEVVGHGKQPLRLPAANRSLIES